MKEHLTLGHGWKATLLLLELYLPVLLIYFYYYNLTDRIFTYIVCELFQEEGPVTQYCVK